MDDQIQQPNATGISTPPDGGAVSSTATPPQESPQAAPQPQTTQPQVPAQAQPLQPSPVTPPVPKGVDPTSPNASHPSVMRAGILHSVAEALAGGPRTRTIIDPNTGTTTREQVPLSNKDIGMALALEAIGGSLKGFSVPNGPGNIGRAAGAAGADAIEQQQQAKQVQEQQAQGDQARQYQTMEANLRMRSLALQTGKLDLDSHNELVGNSAQQLSLLKDSSPESIAAQHLSEAEAQDLTKYPIGDYYRLPDGVVPRTDPNTGEPIYTNAHGQIVDKDAPGAMQSYDNTYSMVERGAKIPVSTADGKTADWITHATDWGLLPDSWKKAAPGSMIPGPTAASYDHKATALDQMQGNLDNFFGVLNQTDVAGSKTTKTPTLKDPDVQGKIDDAATKYGVDPALARAVALQESAGRQGAKSGKGATGVMQLMPETAQGLGVDPNNVDQNIDGGVRYLGQMLDKYNGNVRLALAAYNAGPGAVDEHNGIPPFKETQDYVKKITDSVGLDADTGPGKNEPKYKEVDLHAAVKSSPSLVNSVMKFQGMFNATGNYGQALQELGKKDPTAAGQIAQLYGGRTNVDAFDQKSAEMKEQTKDRIKAKEAINKTEELSRQKEQDQFKDDDVLAKSIAGDPNDPGSGSMDSLTNVASMRGDRRERIYRMAKEANPNFNSREAEHKVQVWNDFNTDKGKSSQQVKSGNTLLAHIGHAIDVNDNYRRSNASDLLNKPWNWMQQHTGDPRVKEFLTSQTPVKDEFLKLLQNNNALTQSDKDEGEKLFGAADTPAQTEQVYKTVAQTAAYRMKETNEQWRRVFRSNYPDLITDQAVQALSKLTDKTGKNPTADILGDMDTGGYMVGSASGRGTPGKKVSEVMGRNGQQSQTQQSPQQFQHTATDPKGNKVGWDGSKWVPIPIPVQQ